MGGVRGEAELDCGVDPRVTQFRLFGPFPLRFIARHPFRPPVPEALYAYWCSVTPRPSGMGIGSGAELECGVLVLRSFTGNKQFGKSGPQK